MKAIWYESDPQTTVTPTNLNTRPIRSSWKPTGISHTDPRPPRYTTSSGVTQRHVFMIAYSTACNNEQSMKELVRWPALWLTWSRQVQMGYASEAVNTRKKKKKICCISSLTSKTVLNAEIQGMSCQDTEAFYSLAESQIKQIKLCILHPLHTHISKLQTDTNCCILTSHLKRYHILWVDLIDARCLRALSQVQNRATKE